MRLARFHLAVIVCQLVAVSPCAGQSLAGAMSSDGTSHSVADLAVMVRTATESFRSRAESLIEQRATAPAAGRRTEASPGELGQLLDERLEALKQTATQELQPLRMDGFLGRDEASRVIGQASDSAWLSFEEAVEAKLLGHRIPPRPSEYDDSWPYLWEMAEYVLVERNVPLDYVVLAGSVAVGIIIAWLCSLMLMRLRSSFEARDFKVLGSLVNGVRGPLYLTLALAGIAFGVRRFWLPRATEGPLWLGIKLAFIAASLWLAWTAVRLVAQGLGWMLKTTYREPDEQAVALIRKSLHLVVLVIYAVIVAETVFGVELQNVLIGVGLIGFAVTLAAQDSLKNLFGSLTIVIDRPFQIGDLIEFKGFFGTVEDVGFRSTKVRELDGHLVTIPNAEIVREPVQNIAARPWIRRRFRIGLRYDTSPDKVKAAIAILNEVLSGRDSEPDAMATHVVFEGFGESNLVLLVQYCVEPGDYWEAFEKGSELHLAILERFNEAGIDFAYPTRTTVIETDDGRRPMLTEGT